MSAYTSRRPRHRDPEVRLTQAMERYRLEGAIVAHRPYAGGPMLFPPHGSRRQCGWWNRP